MVKPLPRSQVNRFPGSCIKAENFSGPASERRMNLLITTDCNLDCPYYFAGSLRKRQGGKEMTLPELETVLTVMYPERSPVRLMGGEPTLHSK